MQLIQYPVEVIETWRTGRLGALYINSFTVSRKNSDECSQLTKITRILRRKPIEELAELYNHFSDQITTSCESEDYERAALFRDMRKHFYENVWRTNSST